QPNQRFRSIHFPIQRPPLLLTIQKAQINRITTRRLIPPKRRRRLPKPAPARPTAPDHSILLHPAPHDLVRFLTGGRAAPGDAAVVFVVPEVVQAGGPLAR